MRAGCGLVFLFPLECSSFPSLLDKYLVITIIMLVKLPNEKKQKGWGSNLPKDKRAQKR